MMRGSSRTLMYSEQSDLSSSDDDSAPEYEECDTPAGQDFASPLEPHQVPDEEWRDARSAATPFTSTSEHASRLVQSPLPVSAAADSLEADVSESKDKKERKKVKKEKKVIFNDDSLFNQAFNTSWVQMEPSSPRASEGTGLTGTQPSNPTQDAPLIPWLGACDGPSNLPDSNQEEHTSLSCGVPTFTTATLQDVVQPGGLPTSAVQPGALSTSANTSKTAPPAYVEAGKLRENDHSATADALDGNGHTVQSGDRAHSDVADAHFVSDVPTVVATPVNANSAVDPRVVVVPPSNVFAVHDGSVSDERKDMLASLASPEPWAQVAEGVPTSRHSLPPAVAPTIPLLFRCLLELPAEQINAALGQARVARPELNDERWIEEKMLAWGRALTKEVREEVEQSRCAKADNLVADLRSITRDLKSHRKNTMQDWRIILNEHTAMVRAMRELRSQRRSDGERSISDNSSHESTSVMYAYSSSSDTYPKDFPVACPSNLPPDNLAFVVEQLERQQPIDLTQLMQQHMQVESGRQSRQQGEIAGQISTTEGVPLSESRPQQTGLQEPQPLLYQQDLERYEQMRRQHHIQQQPCLQQQPLQRDLYQQSGQQQPQPLPRQRQQQRQRHRHRQQREAGASWDRMPQNFSQQMQNVPNSATESERATLSHSDGLLQIAPRQEPTQVQLQTPLAQSRLPSQDSQLALQTRQQPQQQPQHPAFSVPINAPTGTQSASLGVSGQHSLQLGRETNATNAALQSPIAPSASTLAEVEGTAAPSMSVSELVSVKLTPAQEKAFGDAHLMDSFAGLQDFANRDALEDENLFVSDTENGSNKGKADDLPDYNPVTGLPWIRR